VFCVQTGKLQCDCVLLCSCTVCVRFFIRSPSLHLRSNCCVAIYCGVMLLCSKSLAIDTNTSVAITLLAQSTWRFCNRKVCCKRPTVTCVEGLGATRDASIAREVDVPIAILWEIPSVVAVKMEKSPSLPSNKHERDCYVFFRTKIYGTFLCRGHLFVGVTMYARLLIYNAM
jgi:hypothetical protein